MLGGGGGGGGGPKNHKITFDVHVFWNNLDFFSFLKGAGVKMTMVKKKKKCLQIDFQTPHPNMTPSTAIKGSKEGFTKKNLKSYGI